MCLFSLLQSSKLSSNLRHIMLTCQKKQALTLINIGNKILTKAWAYLKRDSKYSWGIHSPVKPNSFKKEYDNNKKQLPSYQWHQIISTFSQTISTVTPASTVLQLIRNYKLGDFANDDNLFQGNKQRN